MLNWLQEQILNLTKGDDLIRLFETFYSKLSEFNQFLFLIGTAILVIIGLYVVFKKILKMSLGLVKFAIFALLIFYLVKILFNI